MPGDGERVRVIDLSQPLYTGMQVYPGDPEVRIDVAHRYDTHGWELRKLEMGSHTGTHVDAISHMVRGGAALDAMPLERFFGKACVVDPNSEWPRGMGLFFVEPVGEELADRIAAAQPGFVGGPISEPLQRELLGRSIVTYTDLCRLEQIPKDTVFWFFGLPLKIVGGDGSPVRALAIVPNA